MVDLRGLQISGHAVGRDLPGDVGLQRRAAGMRKGVPAASHAPSLRSARWEWYS